MMILAPLNRCLMIFSFAFLSIGLVAPPSFAQDRHDRRTHPTDAQLAEKQAKMLKRLEQVMQKKVIPRLELDESQADRLLDACATAIKDRQAAKQRIRTEHKALRTLLQADASESAIDAQMQRLQDAKDAAPQQGALLEETARFLSTTQQAKLTLLLPKIMKRGRRHHRQRHRRHDGADHQSAPPLGMLDGSEAAF